MHVSMYHKVTNKGPILAGIKGLWGDNDLNIEIDLKK